MSQRAAEKASECMPPVAALAILHSIEGDSARVKFQHAIPLMHFGASPLSAPMPLEFTLHFRVRDVGRLPDICLPGANKPMSYQVLAEAVRGFFGPEWGQGAPEVAEEFRVRSIAQVLNAVRWIADEGRRRLIALMVAKLESNPSTLNEDERAFLLGLVKSYKPRRSPGKPADPLKQALEDVRILEAFSPHRHEKKTAAYALAAETCKVSVTRVKEALARCHFSSSTS